MAEAPNNELAGKVAIVTGSSSGIGEEIARRLSDLGATVVVNSANSVDAGKQVANTLSGKSLYVQADISDRAACQTLLVTSLYSF